MSANGGYVANQVIGDETNQAIYYDKASHYDVLWGQDNIHLGYYPHLGPGGAGSVKLNFKQAGTELNRRMVRLGNINHTSKVLDLGCGKGFCCREIAELSGAECVGMDLSENNIVRANQVAKDNPHLKLSFLVGSFTDLPQVVVDGGFTHVVAQVAFCHVHKMLPEIFAELGKVLQKTPGCIAVINDYLGTDGEVTENTKENVWKRLHFDELKGHKAWRRAAEDAGLDIVHYENMDAHHEYAYRCLTQAAAEHAKHAPAFMSADGTPIEENYRKTVEACMAREIGQNLVILRAMRVASRL